MACFLVKRRAQANEGEAAVYMHEVMKHELQTNSSRFCFVRYSLPIVIGIPHQYVRVANAGNYSQ